MMDWAYRLADVPDWAIDAEWARRHRVEDRGATVWLPGLTVDPIAGIVSWRGREVGITGRRIEVLYALATDWTRGHRRTRRLELAQRIWRGWDERSALKVLNPYLTYLRAALPGLLATNRAGNGLPGRGEIWLELGQSVDVVPIRVKRAA